MERLTAPGGTIVSYEKSGSGPPLVLVHGGFSNHHTNWEFVEPILRTHFTIYAIARRGRGATDPTQGHTIEDEGNDVAALIRSVGQPVFLLGHSYGGQCALAAALRVPDRIRKLVVYEAPWPDALGGEDLARLEALAAIEEWDDLAARFFRDMLSVPAPDVEELRTSALWPPIVADAKATLGDLRALTRYRFDAERWRSLHVPVLLQIGSESPRHLYVTDALAAVLPHARVEALPGQAHEGMTTAPDMYAEAIMKFWQDGDGPAEAVASLMNLPAVRP
jgi:pimeloyl-ACP methyl ester carboxylesterase